MKNNTNTAKISDSHPLMHALIVCFASTMLVFIASYFIEAIGSIVVMACRGNVSPDSMDDLSNTNISAVISLLAMALILLVYRLKHRHDLYGIFNADKTGLGLLLGWSVLIINVFTIVAGLVSHKAYGNIGTALLLGLQPGVSEELTFRIIPISLAMRSSKRKQLISPVIIFTSIIFGLTHGLNIFAGADPVTTLFQVIYATGTGCLFAVIYMRTGNMWISILLHSFTDIVYYLGAAEQGSGGVLSEGTGVSGAVIMLIYAVLYFTNALMLYRKSNIDDIAAIWARIWKCKSCNG